MAAAAKLRYYDTSEREPVSKADKLAIHSEFLRTGRISRMKEDWLTDQRRYMTAQEVAQRTGERLKAAGERTHERINGFHRSIQLPKLVFHRTLDEIPHLGYCHVTASRTNFAHYAEVRWGFYIANFFANISEEGDRFFERISPDYSRMYFAVAMSADSEGKSLQIDRSIRRNGLLFQTRDPAEALRNVLLLGARNRVLREIVRRM